MRQLLLTVLLTLILPVLALAEQPLRIVTTTAMVGDLVREVAGPAATVEVLMGPGVDPHLHTPTRDDLAKLMKADIIFYSGLRLEGRMADSLGKLAARKTVVELAASIPHADLLQDEGHDSGDPHLWMDVAIWARTLPAITEAIAAKRPTEKEAITARATAFAAQLESLDRYAREVIATIPAERRILITAHDAFGYFGRAYSIEVKGIQGISTESEAGLADLNRIIDLIVTRKVSAVFVESSVSEKNVRALVEGARSRGHEITVGGELFSDAMGAEGAWEGTYLGMIDHNVSTIGRALGGKVPEGDFRGWRAAAGGVPAQ